MEHNILCKYNIKQIINAEGNIEEFNNQELKEAV